MKKLSLWAHGPLGALALLLGLHAQTMPPFATDFEASDGYALGSLAGQDGWAVLQGSASVTNGAARSGVYSIGLLPGPSQAEVGHAFASFTGSSVTYIDFLTKPSVASAFGESTRITAEGSVFSLVRVNANGHLVAFDGDGAGGGRWVITGRTVSLDENAQSVAWVRFTLRQDYAAKRWDLYLDGQLVLPDLGVGDHTKTHLTRFSLLSASLAATFLDDFYVASVNPLFVDADNDGMEDSWETSHGLNASQVDRAGDLDADGLSNVEEYALGTQPNRVDSDADGLPDGWEVQFSANPLAQDAGTDPYSVGRTLAQSYAQALSPWPVAAVSAGLRAWYRADTGVQRDEANKVSAWRDVSGNGHHMVQEGSDGYKPDYVPSGMSGQPVVEFTGAEWLVSPGLTTLLDGADAVSVVVAFKPQAQQFGYSAIIGGEWGGFHLQGGGNNIRYSLGWSSPAGPWGGSRELSAQGGVAQVMTLIAQAGGEVKGYLNGVLDSQGMDWTTGITKVPSLLSLGAHANGTQRFRGQIAEILVYNRTLTIAERTLIEAGLIGKYQVNDTDADGLPDSWEWRYLGTLEHEAGADPYAVGRTLAQSHAQAQSPLPVAVVNAGLRAWYRADMGVQKDEANKVSVWRDLSGSGHHVAQAGSDSHKPNYVPSGMSGQPVVEFTGSEWLVSPGLTTLLDGADEVSVVVVFKPQAQQVGYSAIIGGEWAGFNLQGGWDNNFYSLGWSDPGGLWGGSGQVSAQGEVAQIMTLIAQAGGEVQGYLNGVLDSQGVDWTTGITKMPSLLSLGAHANSTQRFRGQIAEILVFNRALGEEERESLESVLSRKYINSDGDNDGMLDSWELRYLATLDYGREDDPGGIGRSLGQSFLAQQNPWPEAVVADGLKAWYRADKGVFRDESDRVSGWTDISGQGLHVKQDNPEQRPSTQWDYYALQGVSFTANTQLATGEASARLAGHDFSVVMVVESAGTDGGAVLSMNSSDFEFRGLGDDYDSFALSWRGGDDIRYGLHSKVSLPLRKPRLVTVIKSGHTQRIFSNGMPGSDEQVSEAIKSVEGYLALGGGSGSPSFQGTLRELLFYDRALSETERAQLETSLNQFVLDNDGDGLVNAIDPAPNNYYNAIIPRLTVQGDQFGEAGNYNADPFVVTVYDDATNRPLSNAPVSVTELSGGGKVSLEDINGASEVSSLVATTDAWGAVKIYFKQPAVADVTSRIRFQAGAAQEIVATTSVTTGDTDFDNDGLDDHWENRYFGSLDIGPDDYVAGGSVEASFIVGLNPWGDPLFADGLRARYKADFGTQRDQMGRVLIWPDVSGNGAHLLAHGAAVSRPRYNYSGSESPNPWATIEFDEDDGMMTKVNDILAGSEACTVSLLLSLSPEQMAMASVVRQAGAFAFEYAALDEYRMAWLGAGNTSGVASRIALAGNEIQHVVFVKAGSQVRTYLNGRLMAGGTYPVEGGLQQSEAGFRVGAPAALGGGFRGQMLELQIYDQAFSAGNIAELFDALVETYALSDINANGIADEWERTHFGGVGFSLNGDADQDGIANAEEYSLGTDPNNADSDGDTLSDREEQVIFSNPSDAASNSPDRPAVFFQETIRTITPPREYEVPGFGAFMGWANFGVLEYKVSRRGTGGNGTYRLTVAYAGDEQWQVNRSLSGPMTDFLIWLEPGLYDRNPVGWNHYLIGTGEVLKRTAKSSGGDYTDSRLWYTKTGTYMDEHAVLQTYTDIVEVTLSGSTEILIIPGSTSVNYLMHNGPSSSEADEIEYHILAPAGSSGELRWLEVFKPADSELPFQYAVKSWRIDGIKSPRYTVEAAVPGSVEIVFLNQMLRVDGNRDGEIASSEAADDDLTSESAPFRFWINDDDDSGATAGDDIPGRPLNDADFNNPAVDSVRDLVDFFPTYFDIGSLVSVLPPSTSIKYKLKQADGALNLVYTNKTRAQALDYQKQILSSGFGSDFTQAAGAASIQQITATGIELNAAFLDGIKNYDWGVVLIEGRVATEKPLVLTVEQDGRQVVDVALNLKISPVEQMFRHVNLTAIPRNYDNTALDLPEPAEPTRTGVPLNWPDSLTNGKYFVFVHGYNVDAQKARGWNAEVFKRMHVLGSKARFLGVTWHGATGLDYHKAVYQAFQTGDVLADVLSFTGSADVTIAAHSLGNMVVSHAIQSGGLAPSRYYMINAATPLEAYDLGDVGSNEAANMTEEAWRNYDSRLYMANWHMLFTDMDNRSTLTWRLLFENVALTSGLAHNFFSAEEDVVRDADENASASIVATLLKQGFDVSSGAWKAQELVKGVDWTTSLASIFMIRGQAGWGFNLNDWYTMTNPPGPSSQGGGQMKRRLTPTEAAVLVTADHIETLKTKPFFDRFRESALMSSNEAIASDKAGENLVRYDLFARGIPAMSNAVAANAMVSLGNDRNFPMHSAGKVATNGPFPTPENEWRHSDFKVVALPYVYPMYESMINRGALK